MSSWREAWAIRPDVLYFNHGSFGASPRHVIAAREEWTRRLESDPMDFFVRQLDGQLEQVCERLGRSVGADPEDLLLLPNATVAMNLVAHNIRLKPGDQILTTNHEYGAVSRIWREACRAAGAELVVQALPDHLKADEDGGDRAIVEALMAGVTTRTRLIVASHVTSATAVIFPIDAICRAARGRGIPVCIDGPHAPGMVDVDLRKLNCDFYCASLHKWVSAPFGTGFLYVRRKRHQTFAPQIVSWGGSLGGAAPSWKDEFTWFGTYDPAPWLAIPAALDYLEEDVGLEIFRRHAFGLIQQIREQITALTGLEPLIVDSASRQGSMISLPMPDLPGFEGGHGRIDPMLQWLWNEHRIEALMPFWRRRRYLRVSCHLYNSAEEVERLCDAVRQWHRAHG